MTPHPQAVIGAVIIAALFAVGHTVAGEPALISEATVDPGHPMPDTPTSAATDVVSGPVASELFFDMLTVGAYLLAVLLGIVVILLLVCNHILDRQERADETPAEHRRLMAEIARQPRDGG